MRRAWCAWRTLCQGARADEMLEQRTLAIGGHLTGLDDCFRGGVALGDFDQLRIQQLIRAF